MTLAASVFNLLGPFLVGAAVADTIGGLVTVAPSVAVEVIGAGLVAAVAWNLVTWRLGLPSSSGHALVGGLVGASLAEGGVDAVRWGGLEGWRPVGVLGTLVALAVSPPLGALAAILAERALRRLALRATRRWRAPVRAGEWVMSAALAFSHGANDAQKSIGVVAARCCSRTGGSIRSRRQPGRSRCARRRSRSAPCSAVGRSCVPWVAASTASGRSTGWRARRRPPPSSSGPRRGRACVYDADGRLVGRRRRPGRRRWHHVHWGVVRQMALAWLVTLPVTAALGGAALALWRI